MHTPLVISRSVTIPIDFPSSSTTSSELTFLSNIFLAASLAFCDVRIISILVVIISLTCFDTAVCNARVLYILILHWSPTLARFLFWRNQKGRFVYPLSITISIQIQLRCFYVANLPQWEPNESDYNIQCILFAFLAQY